MVFQKQDGEIISPDSLDLHGRNKLRTDTSGINPGRDSSARSELSPDGNDDDDDESYRKMYEHYRAYYDKHITNRHEKYTSKPYSAARRQARKGHFLQLVFVLLRNHHVI